MKKILLFSASIFLGFGTTYAQQHNYLISSNQAKSVFIRDAVVAKDNALVCAIDLEMKKGIAGGIAKMAEEGSVDWAKVLNFEEMETTFSYDIKLRDNGNFYVHGLTKDGLVQYAFLVELSPEGAVVNSFYFDLGDIYFYAINKMEIVDNGDLLFFFSHYDATSIVRTSADGELQWGKTISRNIYGTGKQPGYDFRVMEDGSIIATGKNNYHFAVLKLSSKGRVIWDRTIQIGEYAQAKSIELLPSGNFVVSGDYLPVDGRFTSFIMEIDSKEGNPVWAKQLDQFDGSFHYQQLEWVKNELHLSLMGNNNPSMMNPDFQNYYIRLTETGDVIKGYRNGEKYNLADYQRLIRGEDLNIIYGSVYKDDKHIEGMVHTYNQHELDACYWTELNITTSSLSESATVAEGIYESTELTFAQPLKLTLTDLQLNSEGTCRPVMDESTANEEFNAINAPAGQERTMLQQNEFMVYPNPNDGYFMIKTTFQTVDATVIDVTGKVIYQGTMEDGDRIDLSDQPSGVYLMNIVTQTETLTRRVVIK